ncbi:unnamed protein product [Trichobilharzia szidati]|nr:unnamed protein product [Trichobilharzia szidati]
MLKFNIANPTDEFQIVTSVPELSYKRPKVGRKSQKSRKIKVVEKPDSQKQTLKAAWSDDDDDTLSNTLVRCFETDLLILSIKVDGSENALLRDRVYENFSISSAKFTACGDKVIFTGNTGSFRIYNLETGSESRARRFIGMPYDEVINKCAISLASPNFAALGTNGSTVYLADLRSLEKVAFMRGSGMINSLCFAQEGTFLHTYGAEGSVYVFDLRSNKARIIHHWFDQASTNGLSIAASPNSQWIACG